MLKDIKSTVPDREGWADWDKNLPVRSVQSVAVFFYFISVPAISLQ